MKQKSVSGEERRNAVGVSREGTRRARPNPKKGALETSLVGLMSNALLNGLTLGAVVLGGLGCDTVRLCADNVCEQKGIDAGGSGVGIGAKPVEGTGDGAALEPTGSVGPDGSGSETSWGETSYGGLGSTHGGETSDESCDPVSERGCDGETPWCLGEGELGTDGGLLVEPRCVECEENSHCAFPYAKQGTLGLCVNHTCAACELATNRGCGEGMPYCVEKLVAAPLDGDASVGSGETSGAVNTGAANTSGDASEPSGALVSVFECGVCLEEAHCSDGLHPGMPACAEGQCVECSRDEHCESPEASRCDLLTNTCQGCTEVGQCAHLSETPACDTREGKCVECTREESEACGYRVCNVIEEDAAYQTCSNAREGGTTQCGECVNDAQCWAGYRCVAETYRESGGEGAEIPTGKRYCMALERELGGDRSCLENRPFVGVFAAESENGVEGRYCRLLYTTCLAYMMFENGPDIIPEGESGAGLNTCNGHDRCGLEGIADGYCVRHTNLTNRCTYECISDNDCSRGVSCDQNNPPIGVGAGHGVCKVSND